MNNEKINYSEEMKQLKHKVETIRKRNQELEREIAETAERLKKKETKF